MELKNKNKNTNTILKVNHPINISKPMKKINKPKRIFSATPPTLPDKNSIRNKAIVKIINNYKPKNNNPRKNRKTHHQKAQTRDKNHPTPLTKYIRVIPSQKMMMAKIFTISEPPPTYRMTKTNKSSKH
jgi:hypothetical protein